MAEWPLSTPSAIRLDLFPAYVTRPHGIGPYTDRARVIITDSDFYVFVDAVGGPECEISGPIFDVSGDNRSGYSVQLEDDMDDPDAKYVVLRSTNCGCGSRLRGFAPFPGVPYSRI